MDRYSTVWNQTEEKELEEGERDRILQNVMIIQDDHIFDRLMITILLEQIIEDQQQKASKTQSQDVYQSSDNHIKIALQSRVIVFYWLTMRRNKSQNKEIEIKNLQDYEFQVDSSIKQDLIVKITRNLPKHIKPQTIGRLYINNPYVVTKKSYGNRRDSKVRNFSSAETFEKPILKKRKPQKEVQPKPSSEVLTPTRVNVLFPMKLVVSTSYFKNSFFSSFVETSKDKEQGEASSIIELSIPREKNNVVSLQVNDKVVSTIEIVTNQNKKIDVNIHKALIQANNPTKVTSKDIFEGVSNPFNFALRQQLTKKINFMKDYKSGYAPIELQNMNQTQTIKQVTDNAKTHFIRKKQSTLSLPRTCGVSYIKPSESTQGAPFSPLPPLIFQCSSQCDQEISMTPELQELTSKWIDCLWNSWLIVVQCQQEEMRELLLGKTIGKIRLVKGIQNLWLLITQKSFVALSVSNPCASHTDIWRQFHDSDIKIGILGKKSTSGKKSFFKSVGLNIHDKQPSLEQKTSVASNFETKQENLDMQLQTPSKVTTTSLDLVKVQQTSGKQTAQYLNQIAKSRSVLTLSIRLQIYVNIVKWSKYDKETKNLLNYLVLQTKQKLESKSLQIIERRLNMARSTDMASTLTFELQNYRIFNSDCSLPLHEQTQIKHFNKDVLISLLDNHKKFKNEYETQLESVTKLMPIEEFLGNKSIVGIDKVMMLKTPLYYISTRDSFAFDLVEKIDIITSGNRKYTRTEYFFDPGNVPDNFSNEFRKLFPKFDVGIVTYTNFYTEEELKHFQQKTYETEIKALKNNFLQMTVQPSIVGSKIKRTKFFFGYRYMWTRCQLAEPNSYVGAGVRKDVTPPPNWIKQVQAPLVEHGLVEKNFINSIAINVYHDGKQGLAQHFDDAVRFKQPIYTIRLFSDARLSFGSQLYGFCNSAFVIPLPRGCICVMTQHSYAANGVKHCVRPVDMAGKSAAVILRQMHSLVTTQVDRYDQQVDFPLWVSTLSSNNNCVTFAEQKRRQADVLMDKKQVKIKPQSQSKAPVQTLIKQEIKSTKPQLPFIITMEPFSSSSSEQMPVLPEPQLQK